MSFENIIKFEEEYTNLQFCDIAGIRDQYEMWTLREVGAGASTQIKLIDFRNLDYEFELKFEDEIEDVGFFDQRNIDVDEDYNVYFGVQGDGDKGVYKYSYQTGEQLWYYNTPENRIDSVIYYDNKVYYLNYFDDKIVVLSANNGNFIDTINLTQQLQPSSVMVFSCETNKLYVTSSPSSNFNFIEIDPINYTENLIVNPVDDPDADPIFQEGNSSYNIDYLGNHYLIYSISGSTAGRMIKLDKNFNEVWKLDINFSGNDFQKIAIDLDQNVFYSTKSAQTSRVAAIITDINGENPSQEWIEDAATSAGLSPNIRALQAERSTLGRVFSGHSGVGNINSWIKADGSDKINHVLSASPSAMVILPGFPNKVGGN